ncbi:MAG: UDP-N-acetylmuramoyl-tripeptide--D-alanyl-D-alanine ligase [Chromatiales bacterium]|nr:UDP-N-acetylmuramoyl-tripeptide--D-alanyl-D-alanine ligase [Chromatiales bacterium]
MAMSLSQAARPLAGTISGADATFTGVSTDTRRLAAGNLFVALRGANFDGHAFLAEAQAGGAAAALVNHPLDGVSIPQLVVADTLAALQVLAHRHRQSCAGRVIALTGSNGKTTVKEMIAAILRAHYGPESVLATRGNLNNHIGVPLMLCELDCERHQAAVFELGANHRGEIAMLAALVEPEIALVTNVAPAHLEGFGSVEAVAQTKGAIYAALPADGTAVVNADEHFAPQWVERLGTRRCIRFGASPQADVRFLPERLRTIGAGHGARTAFSLALGKREASFEMALLGRHNVLNAAAAMAVALALDIPAATVADALAELAPAPGRLNALAHRAGGLLIDDSYNANPASLAAAIEVLASAGGERVLVLGDMAELGDDARGWHARAGAFARAAGIDRLVAVGPLSAAAAQAFGRGGEVFADRSAATRALRDSLAVDQSLLVKGSRTAGMDAVVRELARAEG